MRDIEDTTAVQIVYAYPGFFWYTAVTMGAGLLRGFTGFIQFVPAIILLPSETDMDPLLDPVDRAAALYDVEYEFFTVKFGIDYTSAEY